MTHRCTELFGSLSHGGLYRHRTLRTSAHPDRLWASDASARAVESGGAGGCFCDTTESKMIAVSLDYFNYTS